MNPSRIPGRRGFLRLLGLLCAVPSAGRSRLVGRPPGGAPIGVWGEGPDWLEAWNRLPRHPVTESRDPTTAALLEALGAGRPLAIYYHGGSQPGRLRRFSPECVFRPDGILHAYASGYCHLRRAPRILRVDRIALA